MHVFAALLAAATVVYGSTAYNNSAVYKALYAIHSSSTPVFQNVSGQSANPLVRVLQGSTKDARSLVKRDELPVGTCAPGIPCANGACCSKVRGVAFPSCLNLTRLLGRNLWILARRVWQRYLHFELRCKGRMRAVRPARVCNVPPECLLLQVWFLWINRGESPSILFEARSR